MKSSNYTTIPHAITMSRTLQSGKLSNYLSCESSISPVDPALDCPENDPVCFQQKVVLCGRMLSSFQLIPPPCFQSGNAVEVRSTVKSSIEHYLWGLSSLYPLCSKNDCSIEDAQPAFKIVDVKLSVDSPIFLVVCC